MKLLKTAFQVRLSRYLHSSFFVTTGSIPSKKIWRESFRFLWAHFMFFQETFIVIFGSKSWHSARSTNFSLIKDLFCNSSIFFECRGSNPFISVAIGRSPLAKKCRKHFLNLLWASNLCCPEVSKIFFNSYFWGYSVSSFHITSGFGFS